MNPVEQVVEARRPVADIVERLRERAKGLVGYAVTHHGFGMTLIEAAEDAANEIITLRTQLAEAQEIVPWLVGQLEIAVRGIPVRDMTESTEAARLWVERIKQRDARGFVNASSMPA